MKKSHLYLVGLAASLAMAGTATQALADDEITRGQLMAASCKACHNAAAADDGVPELNRIPAEVIESQMKAFRDGDRDATIMDRHAKGYTDEEIESMAGYFSRF
ncbi:MULTISPECIES: c-type cytochrome [Thioalkalivibrio]|uniref:c-type cytochrome n=1 Tax=Thioalkalivibrio TaxID=106633 RepID=UPI0003760807|nr:MULTISPECIES: c-type cytochrome [Thioalkalivibrio]OOC48628.1 cytochrome C, class I [Thioalkalivibrio versutus]